MNKFEIGKEYSLVFKSENIQGRSGSFANTPSAHETLQGQVIKVTSKLLTIKTTHQSNEIDLQFGTQVIIQIDKLKYWFEIKPLTAKELKKLEDRRNTAIAFTVVVAIIILTTSFIL